MAMEYKCSTVALCALLLLVCEILRVNSLRWQSSILRRSQINVHRQHQSIEPSTRLTATGLEGEEEKIKSNIKSEEELKRSLLLATESSIDSTTDVETKEIKTEDFIDVDGDFIDSLKLKRSYLSILTERLMQSVDDFQLSQQIQSSALYQQATASPTEAITSQPTLAPTTSRPKQHIVILGTGWGGHAFLKTIDATKYDVTVISPRNYFTFTPMLAASAVGTVEFRSICEPIRNANPLVNYLEAAADAIDFEQRQVSCRSVKCEGTACDMVDFQVDYDYLVLAVGAAVNTFGIKGVREHCQFLKQVEDAVNLRKAISNCFERANIPNLPEEEIRAALSFVVVGAGPTGVEFTSELRDWLEVEGRRYYGRLLKYVQITLVEAGNTVLAVFDETLQQAAMQQLTQRQTELISEGYIDKEAVKVMLQSGVKEVSDTYIEFSDGERLTYGFCVWAAGNGPIPLVLSAINKLEEQNDYQEQARGRIAVDGWLRIHGTERAFSLGDCSFMSDTPLPATAQVASQQGAFLGRLFSKGFDMSVPVTSPPTRLQREQQESPNESVTGSTLEDDSSISIEQQISNTAQSKETADRQQPIRFASDQANIGKLGVSKDDYEFAKPFQFLNLGVLAYLGASNALAQISVDDNLIKGKGSVGFLLWRGIYWFKQVSWRNRLLISIDWVKGRLFGRDIGAL